MVKWVYKEVDLAAARKAARDGAKNVISLAATSIGLEEPPYLTESDELVMVRFYSAKTSELCQIANLPAKVKFTAVILMLRFFANQSAMMHDPGVLMFTCAFLACKLEEYHRVSLKQMLNDAEMKSIGVEEVLGAELTLLEGIGFEISITNCLTVINGLAEFWMHMKTAGDVSSIMEKLSADTIKENGKKIKATATEIVLEHLSSDIFLRFETGEVACGAVMFASDGLDLQPEEFWKKRMANEAHMDRVQEVRKWLTQAGQDVDPDRFRQAALKAKKIKKFLKKLRKKRAGDSRPASRPSSPPRSRQGSPRASPVSS